MKKKTAVILSSCAAIAVCSSLIVGSTYALFTSEDKVNIAVTSGKLGVTATIDHVETDYVKNAGLKGVNSSLTADPTEDGKTLIIGGMLPGDIVTFEVAIESQSTVDIQYRLSFGCEEDSKLFSQLLMGVADKPEATEDGSDTAPVEYTYYAGSVSAWQEHKADDKKIVTKLVSLELPAYVGNEYNEVLTCNINFAVEAVQGNAVVSESAVLAHRVTSENIDDAVANLKDNDALILDENGMTATISTEKEIAFSVKGYDVKKLIVDAPNATIHYYIDKTNVVIVNNVAPDSLYIYGNVTDNLELNNGHVEVKEGASVATLVVAPQKEGDEAILTAVNNSAIGTLNIKAEGGKAEINVDEEVQLDTLQIEKAVGDVELKNAAEVNNVEVLDNESVGNLKIAVTNENALIAAIKAGGEVKLEADITVNDIISLTKNVSLNLNGHIITSNVHQAYLFSIETAGLSFGIDGTVAGSGMTIAEDITDCNGFVKINAENVTVSINGGMYTGNSMNAFVKMLIAHWTVTIDNIVAETNRSIANGFGGSGSDGKLTVRNSNFTIVDDNNFAAISVGDSISELENVNIMSTKRLGIEVSGGEATLTNCKFGSPEGNSVAEWLSTAAAVSDGGVLNLVGGSYSGTNAAYICNSGGTINVRGATLNGTNALKADTKAGVKHDSIINVYSGEIYGNLVIATSSTEGKEVALNVYGGNFHVNNYSQISKALSANIVENMTIVLEKDITVAVQIVLDNKNVTIDLNGNTLSRNNAANKAILVKNGASLTIINGNVNYNKTGAASAEAVVYVQADSSAVIDNVTFTSNMTPLFVEHTASKIEVKNNSVIRGSYYAVGTNAEESNQYVTIELTNSTFATTEAYGTGVFTSVPCALTIDNCRISGNLQAVFVRAGTATIKNSTLTCTATAEDTEYESKWAESGNGAPYAAITIGSHNGNTAYTAATVTLENNELVSEKKIVVISADKNGATLTHDLEDTEGWLILNDCGGTLIINGEEVAAN